MKVAIVHDYLTQRGGAERLVSLWLQSLPNASLYAAVHQPGTTYAEIDAAGPTTSALQQVPAFRRDPRLALPLLPTAISSLRIDPTVDIVLASSTAVAHHVTCPQPVVVYCHSPARWLWRGQDYDDDCPAAVKPLVDAFRPFAKRRDRRSAHRAVRYLANSRAIQKRISDAYGIDAHVVHPPVTLAAGGALSRPDAALPDSFLLAVGRARGYKNIHVVASAAEKLNLPLVVVGELPERRDGWPANFIALRHVTDAELRWLYRAARLHVTAALEDFGLTVVEAHAQGTPTVALEAGGFLDTVDPHVNGILVQSLSADYFAAGIKAALSQKWDAQAVAATSDRFSVSQHMSTLSGHLEECLSGRAKVGETIFA
jgi:glycosyltransferase involved in cell wall biosynthesis